MPQEPREYTTEEVREQFLDHIAHMIVYWEQEGRAPTLREKMSGLAFSFLTTLDGGGDLPGFIVAPTPHESDRKYHQEQGENWYPENHESTVVCDIAADSLHEHWHRKPDGTDRL